MKNILFYDNKNKKVLDILKYLKRKVYLFYLEGSFKEKFIKEYKIQEFPCLFLFNKIILYENYKERIDEVEIENIKEDIKKFTGVTIFIKGTLENPKCKWTRLLINNLREKNLEVTKEFNILENFVYREYLKIIYNVKTFPMIFFDNKFIGGNDSI